MFNLIMEDSNKINFNFLKKMDSIFEQNPFFKKGNKHKIVFQEDKDVYLPTFNEEYDKLSDDEKKYLQPLDIDYDWETIGSLISKTKKFFYLYKDRTLSETSVHQNLKIVLPDETDDIFNIKNDPFMTANHINYETYAFIRLFCKPNIKIDKSREAIGKSEILDRSDYPKITTLKDKLFKMRQAIVHHDKNDEKIPIEKLYKFLNSKNLNRGRYLQFGANLVFNYIFYTILNDNFYIYLELEPKSNKYRLFRDLYEYTPILEGNNSSVSFLLLNIYRGLKPDTRKQLFFKQNLELLSVAKSKPLREQFVSFL